MELNKTKEMLAHRQEPAEKRYLSKQSKEYLARLRLRRFEQIFEYIAENQGQEGRVNATSLLAEGNAIVESMDPEVREDVIEGLRGVVGTSGRKKDVGLDLEGFVAAMADAIDARPGPRTYLLPVTRTRNADENLTHRPKINARSAQLAAAGTRQSLAHGTSVSDILTESGRATAQKIAERKAAREAAELADCTFKPKLNPSNATSSRILKPGYLKTQPASSVPKRVFNSVGQPSQRAARDFESVDKEVAEALARANGSSFDHSTGEALSPGTAAARNAAAARMARPAVQSRPVKNDSVVRNDVDVEEAEGDGQTAGALLDSLQAQLAALQGE